MGGGWRGVNSPPKCRREVGRGNSRNHLRSESCWGLIEGMHPRERSSFRGKFCGQPSQGGGM
eukprot:8665525-Pyramimonas_sp.AAC.1